MAGCPDGLEAGFGLTPPTMSAICLLKSYFGIGPDGLGRYKTGTGMLFDCGNGAALRNVVTAGHNLYDHETRRMAIWCSLWFARDGDASLATRSAGTMNVPDAFRAAAEAPADSDFGVIRVAPLGTDRFVGVPLAVSTATGPTGKLIIGYPNEGACKGTARPYHATLTVQPGGPANYTYAPQPTYQGMSGGPLLASSGNGPIMSYGVHIRGPQGDANAPRAIRFSPDVHAMILGWT